MSFPRYPAYKSTGIDWLGEVPEHWSVNRFKLSVNSCTNGVWGDEASNDENDVICIRVADFNRHRLEAREPDEPTIRNVSDRDIEQRSLCTGDLLIEKSGGGEKQPVGAVVLYTGTALTVCSNFVARMRLKRGLSPSFWRYAHHAAYSVRLNTKSIKQTSGIQNLDQQQYLDESATYPPLEEQLAIASFLDRETAKIDALIAEQQRLIELLQEKRQAVISHAVTKGLNPNAPMKDSGVEWLGEVPEHWEVKSLKHLVRMKSGDFITSESIEPEGAYPVFGGNGLRGFTDCFNRDGSYALIGRQGALCGNVNAASGKFWASEHAIVCIHQNETCLGWLCKMLEASNLNQYSTSAAQPGLSVEVIGNTKVPCPPPSEQAAIGARLDQELSKMDATIKTATHLVAVLGERRSALISAAVTGQIDVRGLVEAEASEQ